MRTGIGYDIHRLVPTLKPSFVPLGGISLPCYFRVESYSDGDVLLHALTDACLGALALGDIGQHFPDSQPENYRRPSSEFVQSTLGQVADLGWRVSQMDSIIFLEEPKVAPHAEAIRLNLCRLLNLERSSVSIKAKTMEGLGPVGERSAISAQVIVTLIEVKK